ncbi:O-methyltransferase [Pontibacter mangrovi]|uniref:Class I SAM-dependent methyltransferase n=1 Tax=Pontibacter mangrovi TaxID=2589816 RepID=A0A501WDC8_9BACT|nr:class I SAM-dependent methyltransferase [Pontibacter mangrovi]TPE46104.1 class I SAM-dependent methyltransferase [Pontibacter mangrovi]
MPDLRLAADYLLYRVRALKLHGVHSPFVFDLYHNVLHHTGHFQAYDNVEALRQELLHDDRQLQVTDFGAGSRSINRNTRKVKDIARTSAKPAKYAQLLFRLVNRFQPETILELGTSLGMTTSYLAEARKEAQIYTFEGCPSIGQVAKEGFKKNGYSNIQLIEGNLDETLVPQLEQLEKLDFAFLDGNHRYEPTLRYFESCLAKSHENTVLVLDDIYWSAEMKRAWQEIKHHPQVRQTIDLFFIGLVFFRPQQPEEHFTLNF